MASSQVTSTATAGPAADTQVPAQGLQGRQPGTAEPAGAQANWPTTGPGATTAAVDPEDSQDPEDSLDPEGKLDQAIFDAMAKLIGQLIAEGEAISDQFGVPVFCVKALHMIDAAMPMKELGQRMRCDPSFVTAIADTLEKRGLATREPNATDRRVKNLVLSTEGLALKRRMEKEMTGRMPWVRVLDRSERTAFLALIRKLTDTATSTAATCTAVASATDATASSPATPSGGGRAGEVRDALDDASAG